MSLKHSLLVLLADNPASGYDLSQQFKGSVGFFWNASHQQVYKELKTMASAGWLDCDTEIQSDRPDKKVYTITDAGRGALTRWLSQPAKPNKYKDAFLIKLYGGRHLPRTELIKELDEHIALHRKSLSKLQGIEQEYQALTKDQQQLFELPYLTLKLGISSEQNWLAWAQDTREVLSGNA
ncbi:PadR family transcriptional regulator [Simiduia aestuariiviva]|uniref:PadR family transcriptional regulator AphA n=1 Tax=Simiduia aestuariiviva TaxID=1510459 RepID=A0A839UPX2_9GAMM|nr:PadR family transcriptional regulator [Simiduia aestuariiviva]MBB3168781.1 PadR family transcriptional regulator AphA [Simiduia aestuariiviva]